LLLVRPCTRGHNSQLSRGCRSEESRMTLKGSRSSAVIARLAAVSGIVLALTLGATSPASAGTETLADQVPANAADAIPILEIEIAPEAIVEPTADSPAGQETDGAGQNAEVGEVTSFSEPLPESASELLDVAEPPTPSPASVETSVPTPTEAPLATSVAPTLPETSPPPTPSPDAVASHATAGSAKPMMELGQAVTAPPEEVGLATSPPEAQVSSGQPMQLPEHEAPVSEVVAAKPVTGARSVANVGIETTAVRQRPARERSVMTLTVVAPRPNSSRAPGSSLIEPAFGVVGATGLAGGILRLVPDGGLPGAGGVKSAPPVTTAVSVAVEFGRAGSGWAGTLVFNVWLKRQLRERRISQRKLGAMSGVDHSTISRLLAEGGRAPTLETATKLTHALRMNWTDKEVATYFDLLNDRTPFSTQRVEWALRGDDELDERDVRSLMNAYLTVRARKRSDARGDIPTIPNAQSTRNRAAGP
jgi:transcriptional regulator with XRE-family HTH domain